MISLIRSKTVELLANMVIEGSDPIVGRPYPSDDSEITVVPPVCVPPAFGGGGYDISPLKDPYEVGDVITIGLITSPTGTTPIAYEWFVNGDSRGSSEVFVYTVLSSDVTDKVGDFGVINIWVTISNACGEATFTTLTINVFDP